MTELVTNSVRVVDFSVTLVHNLIRKANIFQKSHNISCQQTHPIET